MPSYLDFPAAGLANVGSSVFKGLLEGREIVNKEEKLRAQQAHQTFLDRLAAQREQREQATANDPVYHGGFALDRRSGRPLFPLPTPPETDKDRAAREASEATTAWRRKQIDVGREQTPIRRIEEKVGTTGLNTLTPGERALWDAHHKPPTAPTSEHERLTENWLKAQGLPDTPANRLKSPYRPETADERHAARKADRDAASAGHEATRKGLLDLQFMRGGPWIDTREPGISIVDNPTRGEWNAEGGGKSFKRIQPQQQQIAQLLMAQGFPSLNNLKRLAPLVLAKSKGGNLIQWVNNEFQAKVSDEDVREFAQMATTVAYEYSRAIGGSSTLRKFVSDLIRATEVPNLGDRAKTADHLIENTRTNLMNYMRELKGWKPMPFPGMGRTVEVIEKATGKRGTTTLAPYETLNSNLEYLY